MFLCPDANLVDGNSFRFFVCLLLSHFIFIFFLQLLRLLHSRILGYLKFLKLTVFRTLSLLIGTFVH